MKIESIELDNIRSYSEEKVDLDEGLVLIYGDNGSGKSSILGSIFSGLYMSDVMKYMDGDINLDALVNREEDKGSIEINFSINGDTYKIEWIIKVNEKNGERKASTESCTLEGTDINGSVEGVRSVKDKVEDIIGLGAESFINSVYVKQGDITRIVKADQDKRKKIIDGLLGLSKLDDYVERMNKVRLEYGAQKRTVNELLKEKERRIQEFEDKDTIRNNIDELKSQIKNLEEEKDERRNKIEKSNANISKIKQKIQKYETIKEERETAKSELKDKEERKSEIEENKHDLNEELKAIRSEIKAIKNKVEEKSKKHGFDNDRNNLTKKKSSLTDEIKDLRNEITKIEEGDISTIQNEISQIDNSIGNKNSEIDNHRSRISDINDSIDNMNEDIKSHRNKLESMNNAVSAKKERIQTIADNLGINYDDLDELRNEVIPEQQEKQIENIINCSKNLGMEIKENEIYSAVKESNKQLTKGEDDLEFIGNIVDPDKEKIEKLRDRLDNIRNQNESLGEIDKLIDSLNKLNNKKQVKKKEIEQIEDDIDTLNKERKELSSNIDELQNQIEQKNEEKEELEKKKENMKQKLEQKKDEYESIKDDKEIVNDLISKIDSIESLEDEVQSKQKDINNYEDLRSNLQEQFIEKKQEVNELNNKIEDIDINDLKQKEQKFESIIEDNKNKISEIKNKISRLNQKIAERKQNLERVEELSDKINKLEDKKIEAKQEETNARSVIDTYKTVKTKLRKKNIGLLNKYSNQIFKSVYNNKTYQRMEISEDYDINLVTGDGLKINPTDLSGGEKTIVSLSIRAGVYKLLVERNGNADTLPPFILDEPTTFLDDSHVSNLQNVIETITSWDVPQILIVSHREDMIQNADAGYRVSKDPSTEKSSVVKDY